HDDHTTIVDLRPTAARGGAGVGRLARAKYHDRSWTRAWRWGRRDSPDSGRPLLACSWRAGLSRGENRGSIDHRSWPCGKDRAGWTDHRGFPEYLRSCGCTAAVAGVPAG